MKSAHGADFRNPKSARGAFFKNLKSAHGADFKNPKSARGAFFKKMKSAHGADFKKRLSTCLAERARPDWRVSARSPVETATAGVRGGTQPACESKNLTNLVR
jgi:hypothetical protein